MDTFFSKKTVSILSVDWDWFFPSTDDFDWGHSEDKTIFFEMIWGFRAGNKSLPGKRIAIDVMRPDRGRLEGFWERTVRGFPWGLAICESHKDLYTLISESVQPRGVRITNFDAHHDGGYHRNEHELDCGNWARKLEEAKLLKEYAVVYPPWRKTQREKRPEGLKTFRWTLAHPKPVRYDFIYICRSGAWTPTWCDREWLEFIGWWKTRWGGVVWEKKVLAPFALKERSPNLEESIENAKKMAEAEEAMKQAQAQGK